MFVGNVSKNGILEGLVSLFIMFIHLQKNIALEWTKPGLFWIDIYIFKFNLCIRKKARKCSLPEVLWICEIEMILLRTCNAYMSLSVARLVMFVSSFFCFCTLFPSTLAFLFSLSWSVLLRLTFRLLLDSQFGQMQLYFRTCDY